MRIKRKCTHPQDPADAIRYPKAKEAALKALEIDGTLAEAHTSLALVKALHDSDWSGGEREFQRPIALNPDYAVVNLWYGWTLGLMGLLDEAIAEAIPPGILTISNKWMSRS
jgi:hypothetical protein